MAKKDLTPERVRELLDYDPETGTLAWRIQASRSVKVGQVAGNQDKRGFRVIMIGGKEYRAHTVCWMHYYGCRPSGRVAHKSGDGTDNSIHNLVDLGKHGEVTAERVRAQLDYDPETGVFRRKVRSSARNANVGSVAGSTASINGYVYISLDSRMRLAHRLAWLHFYGEEPPYCLDHINGDRSDNRIANLRSATWTQNARNSAKPRTNTSGFKGVCWCKKSHRWLAHIRINKRSKYLGSFETPEAAHAAYAKASEKYFGSFARTK
jgi:hypothetical protein